MQSEVPNKNKDKVRQCSVPLCQAYEKPPFFGFPTKDHMRVKWLKALHMKECYPGMRICKRHFNPQHITAHGFYNRLLSSTVPYDILRQKKNRKLKSSVTNSSAINQKVTDNVIECPGIKAEKIEVEPHFDLSVGFEHEFNEVEECDLCNEVFDSVEMKTHLNAFHAQNPKCMFCSEVFENCCNPLVMLRAHVELKHFKLMKKTLSCAACSKIFRLQTALDEHHKIHDTDPKFNKSDITKREIDGEELVECDFCDKAFESDALMRHLNVHNATTKCMHCHEECDNLDLLRDHLRTKHNNLTKKNFRCTVCPRRLVKKNANYIITYLH